MMRVGMNKDFQPLFLSPLPGLDLLYGIDPRLTPWATVWRRSAAEVARGNLA